MNNIKMFIIAGCIIAGSACFAKGFLGTSIPLPGDSIVPPQAQSSPLSFAYGAVSSKTKCTKLSFVTTKVLEKPKGVQNNQFGKPIAGTWSEEWKINACGVDYIVPIRFIYKRQGVDYIIERDKINMSNN